MYFKWKSKECFFSSFHARQLKSLEQFEDKVYLYFPTSTCSACVIPKNFKTLSITHLHVFIVSIYFLKTDNFIIHAASGLDKFF